MRDLYEWLEQQNGGIGTYAEFHQKAYRMAREDSENAAILALLGGVASRFAARFEGEPFSVDDATAAIDEFKNTLNAAIEVVGGSTNEKLEFANSLATFDLLEARSPAS